VEGIRKFYVTPGRVKSNSAIQIVKEEEPKF